MTVCVCLRAKKGSIIIGKDTPGPPVPFSETTSAIANDDHQKLFSSADQSACLTPYNGWHRRAAIGNLAKSRFTPISLSFYLSVFYYASRATAVVP